MSWNGEGPPGMRDLVEDERDASGAGDKEAEEGGVLNVADGGEEQVACIQREDEARP